MNIAKLPELLGALSQTTDVIPPGAFRRPPLPAALPTTMLLKTVGTRYRARFRH